MSGLFDQLTCRICHSSAVPSTFLPRPLWYCFVGALEFLQNFQCRLESSAMLSMLSNLPSHVHASLMCGSASKTSYKAGFVHSVFLSFLLFSFLSVFLSYLFFFKASIIDESALRLSSNLSFKRAPEVCSCGSLHPSPSFFFKSKSLPPLVLVSLEIAIHPHALLSRGNSDASPSLVVLAQSTLDSFQ